MSSRSYKYYDSPDGYDLWYKTEYLCRKIAVGSGTYAITDVVCVTRPVTLLGMVDRFARCFFPPIIAGAIFTTSVYMATNIRKKDDSWNHCIGGFATAIYINRMIKNTPGVWILACPLILTACIYKDMKMLTNAKFSDDVEDNIMNLGGPAIEYDLKRKSLYADKNSWAYADWYN